MKKENIESDAYDLFQNPMTLVLTGRWYLRGKCVKEVSVPAERVALKIYPYVHGVLALAW